MSDDPFVKLVDVSRVYASKSVEVAALSGISLSIERGERVALLGRSGSGKSTLLNLLGGLDQPTSGSICVDGCDIAAFDSNRLAEYRLNSTGIIFQAFNLISTKTALENVELPFLFGGREKAEREPLALAALEAVGLKDRASHRPSELSGGEQQRVAIARALSNRPSMVLADEPTGNLDTATARDVMQRLRQHCDAHNTTVVLVTHDEHIASEFATRTVRLNDGRLTAATENAP